MPDVVTIRRTRRLMDPVIIELLADEYRKKIDDDREFPIATPTIILIGVLDELRALRTDLESTRTAGSKKRRRP